MTFKYDDWLSQLGGGLIFHLVFCPLSGCLGEHEEWVQMLHSQGVLETAQGQDEPPHCHGGLCAQGIYMVKKRRKK